MIRVKQFAFYIICLNIFQHVHAQVINALPKPRHSFIVVSHRGDHTHAPENTIQSFQNAINDSADYVEIDLRTTIDSQLIIMHDASVNRMTDGEGLIKDLTAEQIKKLKVKDKAHPEWGEFDIPFFKGVMQLCKNKIYIYLDFKNADPSTVFKQIVELGMQKQIVVYINNQNQFYQWRKIAPTMPLMVSLPGNIKDTIGLNKFLQEVQPDILDGSFEQYTIEMIHDAEQKGYLVLPDIQSINERPELWDTAVQKGLHALQTDHPGALIDYLKAKKLR